MQRKLVFRLYLYSALSAGLLGAVLYQVACFRTPYWPILGALGVGVGLGLVVGRMAKVSWQAESQQVVATLDTLGKIILAGYLLISVLRWWVLCQWFSGHALTAVALSFTGGMMLGRLLFTRQVVGTLLRAQHKY